MPKDVKLEPLPEFLDQLFELWKGQPRADGKLLPDGRPATNADRSPSDLANYERALKDFALGVAQTEDLARAPTTLLALEEERVLDAVIEGATRRKGAPPSPHLGSSLRSWMRRMLTDLAPVLKHQSLRPLPGHRLWKPYRKTMERFAMARWPEGLKKEFDALEAAYADPFYVGPGREHLKRHRVRPITWQSYRRALNRVVEYSVTVEGLTEMTLLDLVDYDRALHVRAWYFKQRGRGGYSAFGMLCMASAALARYLEITGQLHSGHDPFSKAFTAPWMRFFDLARETHKDGHSRGKSTNCPSCPHCPPARWKPWPRPSPRRRHVAWTDVPLSTSFTAASRRPRSTAWRRGCPSASRIGARCGGATTCIRTARGPGGCISAPRS